MVVWGSGSAKSSGETRNNFWNLWNSTKPSRAHHRFPDWFSSNGLIRSEMASRALKIRDRTVPIGQFMASDISS